MKRILLIDGGPRRNMNTAALCDAFAEGAKAASPEIDAHWDSDLAAARDAGRRMAEKALA